MPATHNNRNHLAILLLAVLLFKGCMSAKEEAAAERNRALQDIDTATNAALQELAEKSADLAVDLAGKIVRAELKPADHSKLIERTMSDFGSEPPSSN